MLWCTIDGWCGIFYEQSPSILQYKQPSNGPGYFLSDALAASFQKYDRGSKAGNTTKTVAACAQTSSSIQEKWLLTQSEQLVDWCSRTAIVNHVTSDKIFLSHSFVAVIVANYMVIAQGASYCHCHNYVCVDWIVWTTHFQAVRFKRLFASKQASLLC